MIFLPTLAVLFLCTLPIYAYENATTGQRRLQEEDFSKAIDLGTQMKRDSKRANAKAERLRRLIRMIQSSPVPDLFKPDDTAPHHNPQGPAVFSAAMAVEHRRFDAMMFVGTARKAGYNGDIVLSILPGSLEPFVAAIKELQAITYTVNPDCTGDSHSKVCSFPGHELKTSINMMRFYMYQWWSMRYDANALIMLSDFRDVFFQANPFTYRLFEWAPPVAQMVVFQEAYPNKVIYRCIFNGGWIENCYGPDALKRIGSNTVSCSGVSIGTRNAIMAYAHLITQQLDPRVRYGRNTTMTNRHCISLGMDQGFHNWLVYSGQLEKYMDLKIYQQGEGPVNTVGAYFGERAVLKFTLEQWKVLRGTAPNKYIHNWNGDISPVVHQADRFLNTELSPGYEAHLAVAKSALSA